MEAEMAEKETTRCLPKSQHIPATERPVGIDDAREHGIPFPLSEKPKARAKSSTGGMARSSRPRIEKFTLEEAFDFEQGTGCPWPKPHPFRK
jgi:hypothetical protein